MSDVVIALMLAAGAAAWTYNKVGLRTGGLQSREIGAAAVVGALAFLLMMTILRFVPG